MLIQRLDWRIFRVDTKRFQGRGTSHAENIARAIASGGWREEKAQLFHLWPERHGRKKSDVHYWVLDGHSRLAGLKRLKPDLAPGDVLAAIHDQLDEAGAIELSKEMNASATPFTRCDMARIVLAEREQLAELSDTDAFEILSQRFSRYTPHELRQLVPLAYLPAELARLVDTEELTPFAGRALGRFIRDTGLPAETVTRIGLEFIRSGAAPKTLRRFLSDAKQNVEIVKQDDLFGEQLITRLADVEHLRQERQRIHQLRRLIAIRREVLLGLRGTPARPTKAQMKLLDDDQQLDATLVGELEKVESRLRGVVKYNEKAG